MSVNFFILKEKWRKKQTKFRKCKIKIPKKKLINKWTQVSEQTTDFRLNLAVFFYIVINKQNINLKLIDYTLMDKLIIKSRWKQKNIVDLNVNYIKMHRNTLIVNV